MDMRTATCIRFGSRKLVIEVEGKFVNRERASGEGRNDTESSASSGDMSTGKRGSSWSGGGWWCRCREVRGLERERARDLERLARETVRG